MGRRGRIRDGGQAHAVRPQVTVDLAVLREWMGCRGLLG